LVDQSKLQRFFGAHVLTRENQVESVGETDATRQSLGPAGAGNQSELNLRQSENRFRMISGDAISAGECRLQPTAQASPVDRGNYGNTQPLDRVQQHLSIPAQSLGVSGRLELEELLNVRAGDPNVGLAADEHRPVHRRIALE